MLQGDAGRAIQVVNAYRRQHGVGALPGSVSKAAQTCALGNGSNCAGSWAETQIATLDGRAVVDKIAQRGRLLDPALKSFGIGWAYDPTQKQYYFAIERHV